MLSRAAAAAAGVVLAAVLAPAAHADGPGGGVCDTSGLVVTVCAEDGSSAGGGTVPAGTGGRTSGGGAKGGSSGPTCTYEKLDPQPSRGDNMYWRGHEREAGALYGVVCPDSGGARIVFIPDATDAPAPDVPVIDPEQLARQAVDSMRLDGPVVASPRAAGTYVIGMPMWMRAEPSPSTFGPVTASASAGAVTVSATARVTSVRWDMGDGTTVTCAGPGTPYTPDRGKSMSPDCGHRYERVSDVGPDERYKGKATSTWTVEWEAPALGDSGTLTETRETGFTVHVVEVQVVNVAP
ncbi:ATP/GTP-binding protein [Streptomyces filamentosus]|uniref:ATP/GTP-binding protein n=1 Tax=Streptomyces filamentosus TaxID=67294 RepID=UPI0036E39BCF